MKQLFKRLIFVAVVAIFFATIIFFNTASGNDFYNGTLISGIDVNFLSQITNGVQMEDARMQVVYQLARRSIVKVVVKDAAGSGIVWKIDDESIVIVSSRHLLMKDVKAQVTFCNDESAEAAILGYSQQYDIGFLKVDDKNVTANILRNIYEAVPVEDLTDVPVAQSVLQIAADLNGNKEHFSTGTTLGVSYEPVFNTMVLKTKCYSKAGMSGGGVFDVNGRLLGMISGGEVAEDAEVREAEVSYSIPVTLIANEYDNLDK